VTISTSFSGLFLFISQLVASDGSLSDTRSQCAESVTGSLGKEKTSEDKQWVDVQYTYHIFWRKLLCCDNFTVQVPKTVSTTAYTEVMFTLMSAFVLVILLHSNQT
jgi:hypothetical protein